MIRIVCTLVILLTGTFARHNRRRRCRCPPPPTCPDVEVCPEIPECPEPPTDPSWFNNPYYAVQLADPFNDLSISDKHEFSNVNLNNVQLKSIEKRSETYNRSEKALFYNNINTCILVAQSDEGNEDPCDSYNGEYHCADDDTYGYSGKTITSFIQSMLTPQKKYPGTTC
jgi:hypothetical protein